MASVGITQVRAAMRMDGVHHGVSKGHRVKLTFKVNCLRETCDSDPSLH